MSHSRNGGEIFALLENTRDPNAPARRYRNPVGTVTAHAPTEVLTALAAVEAATRNGLHACGYVAYEAGYALQNLPMPELAASFATSAMPLLQFHLYEQCEVLPTNEAEQWLNDLAGQDACAIHDLELAEDADFYARKIATIHSLIRDGETYQVNYTLPCRFRHAGNAAALYCALRKTQPVGFSAFLSLPEGQVLSLSPELFMHKQGNTLTTRPMKGTAARGASLGEDEDIAAHLRSDAKSRAENLMIVDLLRNDLGRIAETGSVHVPSLFQIETYETLHQMTSTVTATVAADVTLADIFSALFPCGSVTGAPKRRTMQHIAALEQASRGIYTGAIGYVEPGGDFCFSVPIRTIIKHARDNQKDKALMGVGSGIVFDSSASAEYAEVQLKTRFLQEVNRDLGLIESMHLSPDGSIRHLDLHMARLAHAAKTFGFYLPEKAIRTELAAYTKHRPQHESRRLRLQLNHDGTFSLADFAIPPVPPRPMLVLSSTHIDSTSVFRRHKTTQRALYENEYAGAVEHGAWEVLFLNAHGRIAECARHNIFARIDGQLVTPPVTEGALPGVLRESMKDELVERPLTLSDLNTADEIYVGNAVRGLTRVFLNHDHQG
ncbi:MAG TPA: aminodeoxychorismate synthase component I [Rhodocyclaceae bacterium]|nr:aminodeoxychorismate synthase component I [Rhodocyclaceae bacterium]